MNQAQHPAQTDQDATQSRGRSVPDITLYLLQHSQALRILWLLKILDIPYTLVSIPRRADRQYPELKALSPLGKSPILCIGDQVITESRLCAEALVALRPDVFAQTGQERRDDEIYTELAGATLTPAVHMCLLFDIMFRASPRFLRPLVGLLTNPLLNLLKKELDPILGLLNAKLHSSPYLGGTSLGVSDVLMSWPIDLSVAKGFVNLREDRWKALNQWHASILSMPTYIAAVKECGGYDLVNLGTA